MLGSVFLMIVCGIYVEQSRCHRTYKLCIYMYTTMSECLNVSFEYVFRNEYTSLLISQCLTDQT